jgi:hypothetical protein
MLGGVPSVSANDSYSSYGTSDITNSATDALERVRAHLPLNFALKNPPNDADVAWVFPAAIAFSASSLCLSAVLGQIINPQRCGSNTPLTEARVCNAPRRSRR